MKEPETKATTATYQARETIRPDTKPWATQEPRPHRLDGADQDGRLAPASPGADVRAELRTQDLRRQRADSLLASENHVMEVIAAGASLETSLTALCEMIEGQIPGVLCSIRMAYEDDESLRRSPRRSATRGWVMGVNLFGAAVGACGFPPPGAGPLIIDDLDSAVVPRAARDRLADAGVRACWAVPIGERSGVRLGMVCVYAITPARPEEVDLELLAVAARLARIAIERARSEELARQHLAQLAHVARLATMGEMASGLAHELNQPLCAIVNYAEACQEMLRTADRSGGELAAGLSEISRQALRAGEVIRRLREFVRRKEPQREAVDINWLVREVVKLASIEARQNEVRMRLELADHSPAVLADPIQIEQVLVNLVRNGLEAMSGIEVQRRVLVIRTLQRGQRVEVAVTDHGRGVPEDERGRLFEPFFSTKPQGMGMGLSISRSIIEMHDGRLWMTPNARRGMTFRFTLPVSRRSDGESAQSNP